jgi:glucosamine 6-phosphate synthetase-like amidotransferase/phosphosugar isomerase protein
LAACGTSYYASQYAEYLMRELGCFTYVEAKTASEISECDLTNMVHLGGGGGFLSVS